MIIHKIYYVNEWSLGTIFFKKYPFLFDYDKKAISYINIYNKTDIIKLDGNIKANKINKLKNFWSFFKYIAIFLGIVVGILIGRKIWDKNRKRRANELIDEYQYESCENKDKKIFQLKEKKLYE